MARGKRAGQALIKGTGATPQPAKPPTVAPGGGYGDRKQAEDQAAAAPMYPEGGEASAPAPQQVPPAPLPDVFGPSQQPTQQTSGNPEAPPDAVAVLRAIHDAYPSPWIKSLIGDDY